MAKHIRTSPPPHKTSGGPPNKARGMFASKHFTGSLAARLVPGQTSPRDRDKSMNPSIRPANPGDNGPDYSPAVPESRQSRPARRGGPVGRPED